MGRPIAVVVIRIIETVFGSEKQAEGDKDRRETKENGFEIHRVKR